MAAVPRPQLWDVETVGSANGSKWGLILTQEGTTWAVCAPGAGEGPHELFFFQCGLASLLVPAGPKRRTQVPRDTVGTMDTCDTKGSANKLFASSS